MIKIPYLAEMYEKLIRKTEEIKKLLVSIRIPDDDKKRIKTQLNEIKEIFTKVTDEMDSLGIDNTVIEENVNGTTTPSPTPSQTPSQTLLPKIKIEVRDSKGKKLNAFYMNDKDKPDKITIDSTVPCKKVHLIVTSAGYTKGKTVHLPGDTDKDNIKFINCSEGKEIPLK